MPKIGPDLLHVWEWFKELFNGEIVTFTEMESWARLSNVRLLTEEARWLKMMSVAWIKESRED